jgi:cytochrome c peroxidase
MLEKLLAAASLTVVLAIMSAVPAYPALVEPLPALAPIPADNTMTPEKVALGRMLFFDPRLSGSNWISCATCHNPVMGFTDRLPRAFGHAMSEGPRNTPTILNAAFIAVQFWDGRAKTLEEQALGPVQAEVEMRQSLPQMVENLKKVPEYVRLFSKVFPGDDPVNPTNIAKAIAAFERTLITPDSPYDRFLSGDKGALDEIARKGFDLFQSKGCIACHNGPALTDSGFHRIKVPGSVDEGRFKVTKDESDKYMFRTPTLRNVELTAPYFNNGSVNTLEEAVTVMGKEALNTNLSDDEIAAMTAFLKTLTGTLPRIDFPQLPYTKYPPGTKQK